MAQNGNGMSNPRNLVMVAKFEKANTYIFAAPIIRDREVGGSKSSRPDQINQPFKIAMIWSLQIGNFG
jgi:hypothetical protein